MARPCGGGSFLYAVNTNTTSHVCLLRVCLTHFRFSTRRRRLDRPQLLGVSPGVAVSRGEWWNISQILPRTPIDASINALLTKWAFKIMQASSLFKPILP